MDDGSSHKDGGFYFNTLSYSYEEDFILQSIFQDKFKITTNIYRHS